MTARESYESGYEQQESSQEVTDEDVQQVQDQQGQAQKAGKQVKKQQSKDSNLAFLLSLIIKNTNDDNIIYYISHFIDNKGLDIKTVFLFFLPFLNSKLDNKIYTSLFKNYSLLNEISLQAYTEYIRNLLSSQKGFSLLEREEMIDFLIMIIIDFDILEIKESDMSKDELVRYKDQLKSSLQKELF